MERARQSEAEHRKALEDLIAAESSLKAARLAEAEAHARTRAAEESAARPVPAGADPEQLAALERQLAEVRALEATSREAAAIALADSKAAVELKSRLNQELVAAQTATQEARVSAASAESRAALLNRDLLEARNRIAALEAVPAVAPVAAEPPPADSQEELIEARHAAETARAELKAAREEIRKLRSELSSPKPRPILTSPRPDPGAAIGPP
jgi:hypothetical protein